MGFPSLELQVFELQTEAKTVVYQNGRPVCSLSLKKNGEKIEGVLQGEGNVKIRFVNRKLRRPWYMPGAERPDSRERPRWRALRPPSMPLKFFGGFFNSVNYKNFNLSFVFQFSQGAKAAVYNMMTSSPEPTAN